MSRAHVVARSGKLTPFQLRSLTTVLRSHSPVVFLTEDGVEVPLASVTLEEYKGAPGLVFRLAATYGPAAPPPEPPGPKVAGAKERSPPNSGDPTP